MAEGDNLVDHPLDLKLLWNENQIKSNAEDHPRTIFIPTLVLIGPVAKKCREK
jgi:hypothetical protein